MSRRPTRYEQPFHDAGFSTRTIAVIQRLEIGSLEELRMTPWGDGSPGDDGLARKLSYTPGCGPKAVAEIRAFREGVDPRLAQAPGPKRISVPFEHTTLAALDRWIEGQAAPMTRQEAIVRILTTALEDAAKI